MNVSAHIRINTINRISSISAEAVQLPPLLSRPRDCYLGELGLLRGTPDVFMDHMLSRTVYVCHHSI